MRVRKYKVTYLIYGDSGSYARHEREFRSLRAAAEFCVSFPASQAFDRIVPVEYPPKLTEEEIQVFEYLTDGKVRIA